MESIQCETEKSPQKVKLLNLTDPNTGQQECLMMPIQAIGEGKYAKVYKAFNVNNPSKIYAVKVIKANNPNQKEQCVRQLKVIQKLPNKCRNILYIHKQHLQSQNNFYIFQQLCQGGNLFQFWTGDNDFMPEHQIFDLFYQLCNGFLEMHKAGVVHQDIKPNNILLKYPYKKNNPQMFLSTFSKSTFLRRNQNIYKFCDFGVSQIKQESKPSKTRRGTISYMPPQKLMKMDFIPNARSDIYSLGVTLFQIIFKSHPYLASRVSDYKVYLKKLNNSKLKPLRQLLPSKQYQTFKIQRLYALLSRMLQLNEAKRITLQQLSQYVNTTEPFKSIAQKYSNDNSGFYKIENSEQIQRKRTMMQQYEIINSSVIQNQTNNSEQIQFDKAFLWDDGRVFNFYRDLSSKLRQIFIYLTQGMQCLKLSNQFQINLKINCSQTFSKLRNPILQQLKMILNEEQIDKLLITQLRRVQLIEIVIAVLKKSIFDRLLKIIGEQNKKSGKPKSRQQKLFEQENSIIQSQCKAFQESSTIRNIKQISQILQNEAQLLPKLLLNIFCVIFSELVSIRTNFIEQMLIYFLLKNSGEILQYVRNSFEVIFPNKRIEKLDQYKAKVLIQGANSLEHLKFFDELYRQSKGGSQLKQQIRKKFDMEIKNGNKQILMDLQQNSNQFEILDPQLDCFRQLEVIQNSI